MNRSFLGFSFPEKIVAVSEGGGGGTGVALSIDQSGGTSDTFGTLSGTINGSNTTFTVSAGVYISGSLTVYLNGQLMTQGSSEDWVETTPASGTFDFATAPTSGDEITVIYATDEAVFNGSGLNDMVVNETPSGSVDGSNALFTLSQSYVAGSLQVFRDGQLMKGGGSDYTETSPASGTFTFTTAPASGSVILCTYQHAASTSANADTLDGEHGAYYLNAEGWLIYDSVTPTRTAADDPTYTLQFAGVDLTGIFEEGQPIKLTQNSIVRYGWISSAPVFSTNTTITILTRLDGSSTDYDVLDTSTYPITDFYYGRKKTMPFGMPARDDYWTYVFSDTAQRSQASPVQYTWYNINSSSLSIPLGTWKDVGFEVEVGVTENVSVAAGGFAASLSTSSSTPDSTWTEVWLFVNASGSYTYRKRFGRSAFLVLASKTTYYLLGTCNWSGASSLDFYGNSMTTKIFAKCAYL